MKKILSVFILGVFTFSGITFGISAQQVNTFGESLSKAFIRKVESGEITKEKVIALVENGITYYEKKLTNSKNDKNMENGLKAFQIINKNLNEYFSSGSLESGTVAQYTLKKIIDGDTIKVEDANGKTLDVRLIGVDAPESSTTRYGYIECYGAEAKEQLENILTGTTIVTIETDDTQGETDKYGRLLGYVFVGDTNINEEMISLGYAREYTYNKPYKYQSDFQSAEKTAKKKSIGLRSNLACNGERKAVISEVDSSIVTSNSSTSTSTNTSSSSSYSYSSSKCSAHVRYTGPRGGCYYKNGSKKVYDSTKECCN